MKGPHGVDGRSLSRVSNEESRFMRGLSREVNDACERWLRENDPTYAPAGGFRAQMEARWRRLMAEKERRDAS